MAATAAPDRACVVLIRCDARCSFLCSRQAQGRRPGMHGAIRRMTETSARVRAVRVEGGASAEASAPLDRRRETRDAPAPHVTEGARAVSVEGGQESLCAWRSARRPSVAVGTSFEPRPRVDRTRVARVWRTHRCRPCKRPSTARRPCAEAADGVRWCTGWR